MPTLSPFHRQCLFVLASILLHGLVLATWLAGGVPPQARPVDEASLRVSLINPVSAPPTPPTPPKPASPAPAPTPVPPTTHPAPAARTQPAAPPQPTAAGPAPATAPTAAESQTRADAPAIPAAMAVTGPARLQPGSANTMAAAEPAAMPGPPASPRVELPSSSANYLNNPKPLYPRRSERLGEQGLVLLSVVVTPDGRVREASIKTSSGFERLDQSARDAVLGWTFVPGKRNGAAVEMSVDVPIRFKPPE